MRARRLAPKRASALLVAALVASTLAAVGPGAQGASAAPGDLDLTFGGGDGRATEVLGAFAGGYDVAADSLGRLVTAGKFSSDTFVISRFTAAGVVDQSFGSDAPDPAPVGQRTGSRVVNWGRAPFADDLFQVYVAIDRQDRVIVSGRVQDVGEPAARIVTGRLTTDGDVDPTFGALAIDGPERTGFRSVTLGRPALDKLVLGGSVATYTTGTGLALQDHIVVAGSVDKGDGYAVQAVTRLLPNGDTDDAFGTNGLAYADHTLDPLGGVRSIAQDIVVAPGTKDIYLSGHVGSPGGSDDAAIAVFTSNGAPDTDQAPNGRIRFDQAPGRDDHAAAIAVDAGGRIAIAGGVYGAGREAAVSLLDPNGSARTGFAGDGTYTSTSVVLNSGSLEGAAVAFGADGSLFFSGQTPAGRGALTRLVEGPISPVDTGFGFSGIVNSLCDGTSSMNGLVVQGDGKVVTSGPCGGNAVELHRFLAAADAPGGAIDLPLAASRLVYDAVDGEDRDIFVTDESGTFRRNLTAAFPGLDSDPVLSPDGTKVAFNSDRGGQVDIWVMDVDGSDPVNVTGAYGEVSSNADPAWSPDGTTLAFGRAPLAPGPIGIFTSPADGSAAPSQVSPVLSTTGFPAWSPDGQWIAYRSDRSGNFEIYVTDADTNTSGTNITDSPGFTDLGPAWSPDGLRIAFSSDRNDAGLPGGDTDLWITEALVGEGGTRTFERLLARPGVQGNPAWNPDGQQLAFHEQATTAEGEPGSIAVLTVATGAVATLPTAPDALLPDWYSSVSLSGDPGETRPGATRVDPADIPPSELPITLGGDVAGTPLKSVDIQSSPLKSVPLKSVPLKSVPLKSVPLKSVLLSQIPLKSVAGTWEEILVGTPYEGLPLQNVTLEQLLAISPTPPALAAIDLGDVDLASTPLKSVSMVSLAMGSTPLKSVPLKSVATGQAAYDEWCRTLATLGYSCAALGLTPDSSIFAVDIAGVPLKSVPLESVPLKSVPLKSVSPEALPLKSVPLKSVRLDQMQIGGILIAAIPEAERARFVTCGSPALPCPPTLGEAYAADLIVDGATLGDLFDVIPLEALSDEWDLLDLLQGLVNVEDYPWESLPIEDVGVQAYDPNGPTVGYQGSFTVSGTGAPTDALVEVVMPTGFLYVPGSGALGGDPFEPTVDGQTLTWTFAALAAGATPAYSFSLRPSLRLQDPALAGITVTLGDRVARSTSPITVVEDLEAFPAFDGGGGEVFFATPGLVIASDGLGANDTIAGAVPVATNELVISHIGTPGDVDYFQIPVPAPGTRLQVKLGNPGDADLDVVLLNGAAVAPITSTPLKSVPLKSVPIPDNGLSAAAATDPLSSEVLDDIPNVDLVATPLKSVSQNRSSADELIETTSDVAPAPDAVYYIQVSGFNGASSDLPYVLYVKAYAPPAPPECVPGGRVFPFAGQGAAGVAPNLSGATTLILTSPKRLGDTYGATDAAAAVARLQSLAESPLVDGIVYPIEAGASGALAAWDADPCSPDKANDVVAAVTGIVEQVRAASPDLKHIVIAGGDDIVPFARVADYTQLSNEDDYTAEVLTDAGDGNPIAAAVASQNILSDDPYGDEDPIPWLDHYLYLPEQSLGRLVETPADIAAQADQFLATGGALDPTSALTSGYDFLTDGADAVDQALANRLPNTRTKLVNESWTQTDLTNALFPATGGSPSIVSPNAHYDHNRALPALGNSTSDESDLFTVDDVASRPPGALLQRILFTMGCHAGLAMPDSYVEAASKTGDDWAETYLGQRQRAAVYLANTGYGYGDTAAVALSERLMELFAQRLDGSMTVGEAATYAKHSYFGSLGAYGPYDEKVLQEATFYGLPMYRIGTTATPVPPSPTVTPVGATGDVPSVDVKLTIPSTTGFQTKTSPGGGTFSTVGGDNTFVVGGNTGPGSIGEAQVTQYRPIVPRTSKVVTSGDGGQEAKGFLVTALTSTDVPVIPAVARPVVDLTANEPPPPLGDVAFPTSFSNISTYQGPGGEEQRLVLLPGQVFRNGGGGQGAVERRFGEIAGQVLYGSSDPASDQTAPFLTNVTSALTLGVQPAVANTLQLAADVTDDRSAVVRVVALVKDETNEWRSVEMVDGNGTYTGSVDVVGEDVEYFVQALNAEGLVALSTNKGRYYLGAVQLAAGEVAAPAVLRPASLDTAGGSGWYTGAVGVIVDGEPGTNYDVSVDGVRRTTVVGADGPNDGTVQVSGEGAHVVEAKGDDGTETALFVPIDTVAPTVSIAGLEQSYNQDELVPRCVGSDALSGLASCTIEVGPGPSGSPPGVFTATATAVDRAGNTATTSSTYAVGVRTFSGFLQPVNDTGGAVVEGQTSIFKAGSTVPVKFRLLDAAGNPVTAAVTPRFLPPQRDIKVSGTANEATVADIPTTGSTFTYDQLSGTYQYNWTTTKRMAGSYWRLTVDLGYGRTEVVFVGLR